MSKTLLQYPLSREDSEKYFPELLTYGSVEIQIKLSNSFQSKKHSRATIGAVGIQSRDKDGYSMQIDCMSTPIMRLPFAVPYLASQEKKAKLELKQLATEKLLTLTDTEHPYAQALLKIKEL